MQGDQNCGGVLMWVALAFRPAFADVKVGAFEVLTGTGGVQY
jgi:hypothetical protein